MGYIFLNKEGKEVCGINQKDEIYELVCHECKYPLVDVNKDEKFYCINEKCKCNNI